VIISTTVISGLAADQVSAEDLTYITEQYPPYNYREDGKLQGISVDLLEKIWDKMGATPDRSAIKLLPWTEGYERTMKENNTVLFTTWRIPEREQSFKWAGPIFTDASVLFAKRDRGIKIQSLEDLQKYRIGVIAGDSAIQQLLNIGVNQSQLVPETDASALIAKLENGEIDLWALAEAAGRYFAELETGNNYTYEVVYKLQDIGLYYAFNNNVSDSTVQSFQQALDAVKEEKDDAGISSHERILGRYIPSIGLSHLNYLTEEWAPFNYQEGGNATGIAVGILEAIFKNIGVNRSHADVRIIPLAEGFQATKNGSTVLFSIVRTPEREPYYKWVGPFTKASFVVFAPMAKNITINAPADLNRYRIGAVKDSIENTLLLNQGVNASNLVPGRNPEDLLRMLENEQIDLWATGDLAGRHQMLKTAADPNAYEIVYTLRERFLLHLQQECPRYTGPCLPACAGCGARPEG
jgi:polar amino acid transport system substrate-binding protein